MMIDLSGESFLSLPKVLKEIILIKAVWFLVDIWRLSLLSRMSYIIYRIQVDLLMGKLEFTYSYPKCKEGETQDESAIHRC